MQPANGASQGTSTARRRCRSARPGKQGAMLRSRATEPLALACLQNVPSDAVILTELVQGGRQLHRVVCSGVCPDLLKDIEELRLRHDVQPESREVPAQGESTTCEDSSSCRYNLGSGRCRGGYLFIASRTRPRRSPGWSSWTAHTRSSAFPREPSASETPVGCGNEWWAWAWALVDHGTSYSTRVTEVANVPTEREHACRIKCVR